MQRSFTTLGLVSASYRYFFHNLRLFAQTAAVPVFVLSLVAAANPEGTVLGTLFGIITWVVIGGYAMLWHGTVLSREAACPWYSVVGYFAGMVPGTSRFFIPFLMLSLLAGLFVFVAVQLAYVFGGIWLIGLSVLAGIVSIWVVPRLSLILPARAVMRRDFTFGDAWRMSRGKAVPLAVGVVLVFMGPFLVILGLATAIGLIIGSADESAGGFILTFAVQLTSYAAEFVVVGLIATLLSHAYLARGGEVPDRGKITASL
jgi:hypothetical protein